MRIPCTIMRGGTSKGVFFLENDLPKDPEERKKIILKVFGSPDRRQIDGLGGADLLTSKIAIINSSERDDADVDYVFGQISLTQPEVDCNQTCGNLSSAVGPFAIHQGLVPAVESTTRVRINCLPSGKVITQEVEVKDGQVVEKGDFAIDGVPGTGSKIAIDWSGTAGIQSGNLLPTGKVKQTIKSDAVGEVEISIVDAGNISIFVKTEAFGLRGNESPTEIDSNLEIVKKIEAVRRQISQMLGMEDRWDEFTSPALPLLLTCQKPMDWIDYPTGETRRADSADILCKLYALGQTHKAYGGSPSISTATAAKIKGSVVYDLLSERGRSQDIVRIGHPSGIIPIEVEVQQQGDSYELKKANMLRTARRIMDGCVYV